MARKTSQHRLNGVNPLSYMGVNPTTPPNQTIQSRAPQTNDIAWVVGTIWQLKNSLQLWMLTSLVDGVATWTEISSSSSSGATDFPTNSGTAIEAAGVLNILGTNVIETSGSGNTVTTQLTNGTDGQVLIGGGADPAWANIISMDSSVTITNGANSIDLSVTGGEGVNRFNADVGSAVPVNGEINLFGGELINTSATGSTVTVNLDRSTDGKIPIASSSGPTLYANITSNDSTVTITNGPNSIDLSAAGSVVPSSRPSFFYYQNGDWGTAGKAAPYYLGKYLAMTKLYDFGDNCTPGDGAGTAATFTAPSNGIYMVGVGATIPTTLTQLVFIEAPAGNFPSSTASATPGNGTATILSLSMGDVIRFRFDLNTSAIIAGSAGTPYWYTFFWGYQIST